jgi:hypothetical protein
MQRAETRAENHSLYGVSPCFSFRTAHRQPTGQHADNNFVGHTSRSTDLSTQAFVRRTSYQNIQRNGPSPAPLVGEKPVVTQQPAAGRHAKPTQIMNRSSTHTPVIIATSHQTVILQPSAHEQSVRRAFHPESYGNERFCIRARPTFSFNTSSVTVEEHPFNLLSIYTIAYTTPTHMTI